MKTHVAIGRMFLAAKKDKIPISVAHFKLVATKYEICDSQTDPSKTFSLQRQVLRRNKAKVKKKVVSKPKKKHSNESFSEKFFV